MQSEIGTSFEENNLEMAPIEHLEIKDLTFETDASSRAVSAVSAKEFTEKKQGDLADFMCHLRLYKSDSSKLNLVRKVAKVTVFRFNKNALIEIIEELKTEESKVEVLSEMRKFAEIIDADEVLDVMDCFLSVEHKMEAMRVAATGVNLSFKEVARISSTFSEDQTYDWAVATLMEMKEDTQNI